MQLRVLLVGLALAGAVGQARTEPAPAPAVDRPSPAFTGAMAELVRVGRWSEALRLLDSLPKAVREQPDLLYFRAQLLRKVNRATEALDIYTHLLGLQPEAQLIRLELAQTYYDLHDDPAAERYFRLALAGELPSADRKLAHEYLSAILRRRSWRITANLAFGADSNLNAGTDSRTIQIFGLPFALSDQARRSSGFAVSGQLAAEQSTPLAGPLRLDTIVQGAGVYTRQRAFDVLNLGLQSGPQLLFGEGSATLRATSEKTWFGGRPLYVAYGAIGEAHVPVGSATLWEVALSIRRFEYAHNEDFNGVLSALDLQRTRFLSPTAFWRLRLGVADNAASADYQSYRSASIGVGYFTILPLGLSAYGNLDFAQRRHEGPQPFFDVHRRDNNAALLARLTKRDFTFCGFAPYLEASLEHNASNIPLYRYNRQRLQLGVSRSF